MPDNEKMNISVFGLGYVGAVSCACLARDGHSVTGVDINEGKVGLIRRGEAPILEAGLDESIAAAVRSGRLRATTDTAAAVGATDLSIVCVGTPSLDSGRIDLQYVHKVCGEIGEALRQKAAYHSVVIRSTVAPGTLQSCLALIETASGKRCGEGFGLAVNPEFLREGTALRDYYDPPYIVIGAFDEATAQSIRGLYATIQAETFVLRPEEAEMIKYANNNFHALKITFANEIGNVCKELGIDSHRVMDVVVRDTKLNLSPYYLRPGFAFGGSCLPKDVRGLLYQARSLDLKTPLLAAIPESNAFQLERGLNLVMQTGRKKIGVLGFAFKAGTDDLRESPVIALTEALLGKGYELALYDPHVVLSKLTGKNKEFITRHLPHISRLMRPTMDEVLRNAEVLVIGTRDPGFRDVPARLREGQVVIDLVRIDPERTSRPPYAGICW
jgi:GDP-mannose 6-dehydrogenase